MKTIFDKTTRDELIARINTLDENNTGQWGKMNVFQALTHCVRFEEMALGKTKHKQSLLGRLFGRMALKDMLKDETPLKQNMPTVTDFKVKEETGDVSAQKTRWIAMIEEYGRLTEHEIVHPFFGKMTKEHIGQLAFKHSDHHLRQFGR